MNIRTLREDATTLALGLLLSMFLYSFVRLLGQDIARVAAFTPLNGAFLRFLVNYAPKDGQAGLKDTEDPEQQATGGSSQASPDEEPIRGYAHMLRKTYRIEKLRGLYKGIGPNIIVLFLTVVMCEIVPFASSRECRAWSSAWYWTDKVSSFIPIEVRFPLQKELIRVLLQAPFEAVFTLFVYRTTTSRHPLPFFSRPLSALRALLTSAERTDPVMLFNSVRPFMRAVYLRTAFTYMLWRPLINVLSKTNDMQLENWVLALRVAAVWAAVALCALVVTPLEVATARLAVVYPAQEEMEEGQVVFEAVLDEDSKVEVETVVANAGEKVGEEIQKVPLASTELPSHDRADAPDNDNIPLEKPKSQSEPQRAFRLRYEAYSGLYACLREVFAEEGYKALLRGWYVTACTLVITAKLP